MDLGRIIVSAAEEAGIKHFVFSSAGPVSEITGGAVKVDMMDSQCCLLVPAVSQSTPYYQLGGHRRIVSTDRAPDSL